MNYQVQENFADAVENSIKIRGIGGYQMKICNNCSGENSQDSIYCEHCGEKLKAEEKINRESKKESNKKANIKWETYVPLYTNPVIVKGLMLAIGIPFGILILFLLFISKGDILGSDVKYAFFMIGLLFFFTFLLTMALYGGKYAPGFVLDEKGVINYTQDKQRKRNNLINGLLVFFGLFGGNVTAAGIGFIAESRQVMKILWKNVRDVKYDPKHNTILLKGGFAEKMAVFCTEENYFEVEAFIKMKLGKEKVGGE